MAVHGEIYADFMRQMLTITPYSSENLKDLAAQLLFDINRTCFDFFQERLRLAIIEGADSLPNETYFRNHYPFIFN